METHQRISKMKRDERLRRYGRFDHRFEMGCSPSETGHIAALREKADSVSLTDSSPILAGRGKEMRVQP